MMKYTPLALVLFGAAQIGTSAFAQTVYTQTEVRTAPSVLMTVPTAPVVTQSSVVHKRTIVSPVVMSGSVPTSAPTIDVAVLRSNYRKRLADIKDQIGSALQNGWISQEKADELYKWQSDLVAEEQGLRVNNQGIISSADVDMMEKHVTGLAYVLSQAMNHAE